ncbi:GIY-YIG nuclease family protein [Frigidibacter sp. MR17.24]|uniref:GIY-YIG nuclease family protein n=1 Tax=Frigidibacter sp. MR17.24 TaxID=3127345 RepID=UPI003012D05F
MTKIPLPQTLTINGEILPILDMPLTPSWIDIAHDKGFEITARVRDRFHLALRCHTCAALSVSKIFTLRTAQPLCPNCLESAWRTEADAAGLTWLHRDPDDRHYGHYRMPCGHTARRQFELVGRAARGETGLRCETCHDAKEAAEAQVHGWELVGADPDKDPNYRIYTHVGEGPERCGHRQRIARANMQSQRVQCTSCSTGWSASPSWIYAMRIRHPDGAEFVKLGYSRNPHSRLHYQLKRRPDLDAEILRRIPVRTGHRALQIEKRMHRKLRQHSPEAVVAPERYRDVLRVGSEIYDARLGQVILQMLDALENSGLTR